MSECNRATDTWKKWPARMLRHKAAIQAARYAFSFSGIIDEDEAARMVDVTPKTETNKVEAKPGQPSRLQSIIGANKPQPEPTQDETVYFGDEPDFNNQSDYHQ
ncbi:hypothetical protein D3C71_1821200 [compost metagenome]